MCMASKSTVYHFKLFHHHLEVAALKKKTFTEVFSEQELPPQTTVRQLHVTQISMNFRSWNSRATAAVKGACRPRPDKAVMEKAGEFFSALISDISEDLRRLY